MQTRCCVLLLVALQVVAVLAARAKRASPQQCPEGFTGIGFGMCVSVRSLNVNYFDARSWATTNNMCKADGARLVSLDTPEKHKALTEYLHSNFDFSSILQMWVGATRNATGWWWLNSAPLPVDSNIWLEGEPNPDETYVHAITFVSWNIVDGGHLHLRAVPADSLGLGYVCEATGV
ncbi:killer cell lectin-like receptor subfamily G member 2 [Eriocheir sinensis]|uniref:killer cell lectin-like receptor subfamily G member 2 n=1 Tax=Eriocheir sinensis TaxID=95602 RepID=UPI0021C77A08|nr:killer cell lectin-like receptor subfamily G member 2 [Eriocheir sinensis]